MEIDKVGSQQVRLYTQNVQPAETKKAPPPGKPKEAAKGDEVSLSDSAKELQWAKQLVENAPDVREARVAEIKSRIEDGTYTVSDEAIVDKLLENTHGE